jgi:hypothetical protein
VGESSEKVVGRKEERRGERERIVRKLLVERERHGERGQELIQRQTERKGREGK